MKRLNEAQFRSPKWLRKYFDFEVTTGKDVSPEAKAKRKLIEDEEFKKEQELKAQLKQFNLDWEKVTNDLDKRSYFKGFLNYKGLGDVNNPRISFNDVKKEVIKKKYFDIFNEFNIWYENKIRREAEDERLKREEELRKWRLRQEAEKRREEARRKQEEDKRRAQRERAEKAAEVERELNDLYRRLISDFTNNPYDDKFSTPNYGGSVGFKYRFENSDTFEIVGDSIIYTNSTNRIRYTVSILWKNKFINLANEIISKGRRRPTGSSGYKNTSGSSGYKKSDSGKKTTSDYVHKETPKTGDPQKDKYNLLCDKIRLREDQLKNMGKNNPDRDGLEKELNAYKRVRDKLKAQYKFENMKYIKMFENFENNLTSDQSDDLSKIFYDFIKDNDMSHKDAESYFKPGTQEFADFLQFLETETSWFDYTQIDDVLIQLSNLLIELEYDESEEVEFDDTSGEPDLDIEDDIEAGDYVDFGSEYGKLYVIAIHGDGYLVNDNESYRYLGDNGDGFIIPLSAGDNAKVIEKAGEDDDEDDEDGDIFN